MGLLQWPRKWINRASSGLAISMVKRRLKKRPDNVEIWILLAKLYEVRGDRADAVKAIELAMKRFPDHPHLRNHRDRLRRG